MASGEEAEACQVVGLPPGGLKHNGCQRYEAWKMPREYLYHFISCIMYNIYIICVYIRYIYIYSPVESFQEESYHVISFVVRPVELCQLNNPNCNT